MVIALSTFVQDRDWSATKDTWGQLVRVVSGFALSLMLRYEDRDLDRQFLRPREPGL